MQPSILQFLRPAKSKNKLNSPHGTTWASPLNFTLGNWQKVSDRMSPWNPLKGCNILRKDKTTHLRMSCRACGEENSWFEEQSVSKVLFLHNTMCKKCSSPIALPLCHILRFYTLLLISVISSLETAHKAKPKCNQISVLAEGVFSEDTLLHPKRWGALFA